MTCYRKSRLSTQPGVGDVRNGFGHGAEGWGRLCPAHGACERDGDQLLLIRIQGKDDRETWTVVRSQEQPVKSILNVELGQVHGTVLGIGVSNAAEDSLERTTELHGFGRCVRQSFLVNRIP